MDYLKAFKQASKYEQGNILFASGTFITSKSYQGFKLHLFSLGHHVFEVWYNSETKTIEKICQVTDHDALYAYFEEVDISRVKVGEN